MDGLLLLSILLAQGISAPTNADLQLEASLAFGSYVSNDGFAELHVRALSGAGGSLVIETTGTTPTVRIDLELLPNEPLDTWLPLRIDAAALPVSLDARLKQSATQATALNYARRSLPWFALLGPRAAQRLSHLPGTEAITAAELPHIPEAYRQISALAVDSAAMASLDEEQLRSLLEYVGSCGRVLLIDASVAVRKIFANRAACEGRFLILVDNEENAGNAFSLLTEQASFLLPAEQSLEPLLRKSSTDALNGTRLAFFLGAYLVILIVLLSRAQSRFAALGFSIIATVLVLVTWPVATSRNFVAWAEMASTEQVARYVGIERHSASRRGTVMLPGESFAGYTSKISGENYSLHWGTATEQRQIVWNAAPFQSLDRISQGSFPVNATLRLDLSGDSAGICNTGSSSTALMYLQWQGVLYEIPPMDAGTGWSSIGQDILDSDSGNRAELKLFLERSAIYPLTVLQSLPIPNAEKNEQAWLLRYQTMRMGAAPCAS